MDLSGQKFNKLTVVKKADYQNAKEVRWLCRCDCGMETTATTYELRSGHKKSCGCLKRVSHAENLKGKRFGRLTVFKRYGTSKDRKALWKCKCDCGKTTVVRSIDLKSGNTKSCGCLGNEYAKRNLINGGL